MIRKTSALAGALAMLAAAATAAPALAQTTGAGPTVTCSSDPDIFNTGYNAATGGKLVRGQLDANWQVTDRRPVPTPQTASAIPPDGTTWHRAYVGNMAVGAWAQSPYNNAEWISRELGTSPSGDWYYRYRFDLHPDVDPASFGVGLDFMADNAVWEVYVNGVPQSGKTSGLPQNPTNPYFHYGFHLVNAAQTSLRHDWRTGANEIVVHVKSGAPYEGFLTQARPAGICATDIGIEKSGPADVLAGEQITWTLTVRNNGPRPSSGYTVTDDVPAGVTNVQTATLGCAVTGNRVRCAGGPLEVGEEDTITLTGTAPEERGVVENTATVAGKEADSTPANNSDSATTAVRAVAGLCRATPLAALGLRPGEANGAETPCADAGRTVVHVGGTPSSLLEKLVPGPVTADALNGKTDAGARSAAAAADVLDATVRLPGLTLSAKGVHSEASSAIGRSCSDVDARASSRIATLVVNGKPYAVGEDALSIPVPGVGGVHVNQRTVDGSLAHARVVFVDLPGTALDVTIGESKAQVVCV